MERFQVGEQWIGVGEPVYIVAEAGSNHNRDLGMAKRLIDAAAEARVDAVKFQTYSAETLYSKKTPKFSYLEKLTDVSTYELLKSIEIPREWQAELSDYCREKGVVFFSSPFDYCAVDELDALGVPMFKIASFELVDLPLIRHAASKGKPVVLSTGMARLGEIEEAIDACLSVGNRKVILLQCASVYPAPVHIMNLRAMETMRRAFGCPAGLSDHTTGVHVAVATVALGAAMIEKHYTLDRSLSGPDHPFAIEPDELRTMVRHIRDVEAALGAGQKIGPSSEEAEMFEKGRRSVVAAVDIPAGTVIERNMLAVKRPGFGIRPRDLNLVVGRVAKRDIEADDILTWDMV